MPSRHQECYENGARGFGTVFYRLRNMVVNKTRSHEITSEYVGLFTENLLVSIMPSAPQRQTRRCELRSRKFCGLYRTAASGTELPFPSSKPRGWQDWGPCGFAVVRNA